MIESKSMKLSGLDVEHCKCYSFKFETKIKIFPISQVFNMCAACDSGPAHVKSIVKFLPNALWHVSSVIVQRGNDFLFEFINGSRKRWGT